MHKQIITVAAARALALDLPPQASAAYGPMRFEPIATLAYNQQTAAWTEPFVVPENCIQRLVSDETVRDIYPASTASRP